MKGITAKNKLIKQLMIDYKNVPINTKMVSNMQTNFKQEVVYKSLLWSHLEQKVINNDYVTSLMINL